MNMNEINEAIRELEEGPTTYHNCMKLASLYIVRDMYGKDRYTTYGRDQYNYASGDGRRAGGSSRYENDRYGYDPYDEMIGKRHPMF